MRIVLKELELGKVSTCQNFYSSELLKPQFPLAPIYLESCMRGRSHQDFIGWI
jgi:hypothetical protein